MYFIASALTLACRLRPPTYCNRRTLSVVSRHGAGAWARAPGSFKAVVGASSRDHRLTETFVI